MEATKLLREEKERRKTGRTVTGIVNSVLFAPDGDEVRLEHPAQAESELDVLLIGGVPLGEAVARYGPFVMNTETEIRQAIEDYRSGRMGAIDF